MLERSALSEELVEDAIGRGRLRRTLELPGGGEVPDAVIDQLLAGARTEEEIAGPGGVLAQLTKRLIERALEVELTEHLGYEPHVEPPGGAGNTRNGSTPKTVICDQGEVAIDAPRDRTAASSRRSSQAPAAVRGVRREDPRAVLAGTVDAGHRGAPGGDVRGQGRPGPDHQGDRRGHGRRPRLGQRPLEDVYPVIFLDAMVLKVREGGTVQRKACYLALGVTVEGERDVLGMWFQEAEGAKFWMQVLSELKQRGVQDILICCVDGLKGFPEAIEAIFPKTTVQTCIVHLLRHSLKYVPRKEREQVARDLKPVYTAVDAEAAQDALERFDEKWGQRFPVITKAWLDAWEYVIPFLAFPDEVRRVIYTTNAIEALNRQLRKAIKTKGHFPNEDSARKLIYLAVRNATPQWTRCRNWTTALLAFKIHFGDRLPDTAN